MNGGNDGLNTVIPYADDLYQKARPTIKYTANQVLKVNDHIGLHPSLGGLHALLQRNELAILQGVGYPNPDRSHFESMDIWQTGDVNRKRTDGWLGRCVTNLGDRHGGLPAIHLGPTRAPTALQGAPSGVVSISDPYSYRLNLGAGQPDHLKARRRLMEDLASPSGGEDESLLAFVQRRQVQTYTTLDRMQEVLGKSGNVPPGQPSYRYDSTGQNLASKLQLMASLIQTDVGARIFYVMQDGSYDTHSAQGQEHARLLQELSDSIRFFFDTLRSTGHDQRVLVMTFSEFGRRVQENGSKGTDHGSGSCMFVAGPAVKAGPLGAHPSLKPDDLDYERSIVDKQSGDLRFHTDFRRVYATLLDRWLGVDSKPVLLDTKWEHVDLLKGKA
jgi:uncharacterized protein (DUF1501 family)